MVLGKGTRRFPFSTYWKPLSTTPRPQKKEVIIIQADVAKAFDKIDREALASFVEQIIKPCSPEAAAFIKHMYDGDEVIVQHGEEASHI